MYFFVPCLLRDSENEELSIFNNLYIILRVGNSKIVIFRAVSKIFSCWENTASRIAGVSKLGSTFGSTFPRKVARGNPPPPPPACNNISNI